MTLSYIERAACRGHRPAAFAAFNGYERPHLLGRLMRERNVARFIVAPDGYGKTSLALSYAETMFGWKHVLWLSAQSPCFVRDLDAGILESGCLAADGAAALVVMDQLPPLDSHRAELLSQAIDGLLAHECEVLVTCVPSCDIAARMQCDRIRLDGRGLLLTDDELDATRSPEECAQVLAADVPEPKRVAAYAWGLHTGAAQSFAGEPLREELPGDMLLALASILVLRVGKVESLRAIMSVGPELWDRLRQDYPHLGLSEERDSFEAAPMDPAALNQLLKGCYERLCAHGIPEGRSALVRCWANGLLQAGDAERACEVMLAMDSLRNRAAWFLEHLWEVLQAGCLHRAFLIASEWHGVKGPQRQLLMGAEALLRSLLGDGEGARRQGLRFLQEASSKPVLLRTAVAAMLASREGCDDELVGEELTDRVQLLGCAAEPEAAWAAQLAAISLVEPQGAASMLALWERLAFEGAPEGLLCLAASRLFQLMANDMQAQGPGARGAMPRLVEEYVRERLLERPGGRPGYFAAAAGLSMAQAHRAGVAYAGRTLESAVLFDLRQAELSLASQQARFEKSEEAARAKCGEWARMHPVAYPVATSAREEEARRRIPLLTLRFFGCFQVLVGDTAVEQHSFRRQNARTLLVILAVNQGKEVSRDMLAEAMWPDSDAEVARKNFYTVWSQLRRALSLEDGSCPYLVRHQFGCSLDERYVRSDLARFSEICRDLLFGAPEVVQWSSLYAELDRDFSSDLMPSERRNPLILQARSDYRERLVDALVSATNAIAAAGHPEWGIWFARMALRRDDTREDAWMALMQAQIACSQRTAAMGTFLKCRETLGDRLGIDPSPEAWAVYEGLLAGEGASLAQARVPLAV